MATITNKTRKPVSVPLPGGKRLHLGPLKSGKISDHSIDHPAVQKLIEAGDVEILGETKKARRGNDKRARPSSSAQGHGSGIRRTGDR